MMNRQLMGTSLAVALLAALAFADAASPPPPTAAPAPAKTVSADYPNLASAALVHAVLADLPEGVLLRAGDLVIRESDLAAEIGQAPAEMREQLRRNSFFVMEQMATRQLLLREAKAAAAKRGQDNGKRNEREVMGELLDGIAAGARVTDAEIADFYAKNKDQVGGAKLEAVREAIRRYLLQQKQQEVVDEHIRLLGQRTGAEVAAGWAKRQAATAVDNPVDKARASGKPSLVDFGAKGCRPCDMLAPILDRLRDKYAGKANVVFVSVREEQILASRYGVQAIPVQIFFDKDGKEVLRHVGFYPQEEIEKKMAELGVK